MRSRYQIATSTQVDVPAVSNKALLVMIHRLENAQLQATVLNFSGHPVTGRITSEHLPPGALVEDMFSRDVVAAVDQAHCFELRLAAHGGTSLLVRDGQQSGWASDERSSADDRPLGDVTTEAAGMAAAAPRA